MTEHLTIDFAPLIPIELIGVFGALGLILCFFALRGKSKGWFWRFLSLALLLGALAHPIAQHALLQPVKDVALLLVDESQSQNLPPRKEQMATLLPKLRETLNAQPDLEWREIRVKGRDVTALGAEMLQGFADVAPERRAGIVAVTDGEAHDIDGLMPQLGNLGPAHVLLTGKRGEEDRRLLMTEVPHYGLVGQTVTLKFQIIDKPRQQTERALVTLRGADGTERTIAAAVGKEMAVDLPLAHAGDNIFILSAEPAPNDLSLANNRAVVKVRGVRERLRVLLVSGEPHPGERSWRNLLKSDPSVDLVHFTILRSPQKMDSTPVHELALISFPVRELFEEKLKSFDLIVFDRFRKQGMLPMNYLDNIARYVEEGGAFLDASGPSYVTAQSLYRTPLSRILPAEPVDGALREERFVPALAEAGKIHPVTARLETADHWGPWYRQTETKAARGQVLMTGAGGLPLLVLDRVGKGRVAQLTSDQIWLWAHGHEGGGPHVELMRRLAHWLMQEPELEEGLLQLSVVEENEGYRLVIKRPGGAPAQDSAALTAPDGSTQDIALTPNEAGDAAEASVALAAPGMYQLHHDGREQIIAAGNPDAKELQDLRATGDILRPLAEASGGGIFWLADHPQGVEIRRTAPRARHAGDGWLGLRRNGQSIVAGMKAEELLPAWAWVVMIAATAMLAWRKEGK
ncbi:MAG: hypothetical protein WDO70_09555 [Alphaproteobacteria bacterium]